MCAIAGVIGQNNNNEDLINSMLSMMRHRGPDFTNIVKFEQGFLGHNRLSIIDTHSRSNQPMISNNNRYIIVFNGEIYNYLELKNQLKASYNFKTKGDTEVILAAFQKWGIESFHKLNGAFSFCIYDKLEKKSYFVRDRFGQKPLFFWKKNETLFFSSEIKAFLRVGYSVQANFLTWHDYLVNSDTDTTRDTFFKDIIQLLPGEVAIFNSNNKINFKKWYDLKKALRNKKVKSDESTILTSLLNSVKLCSRADVPQAISLSGGLDSNILLGLYAHKKILTNIPKTFSVEFGSDFSEREFFSISNKKFKNDNIVINYTIDDFLHTIKPIIWHLESPSGGLMNCALTKMCYAIHKDGIKIVQDGTGLDEIFGGYEIHHLGYLANIRRNFKTFFKKLGLLNVNFKSKSD
jgi:asparagine synthase (glutamine-hydrolysing)